MVDLELLKRIISEEVDIEVSKIDETNSLVDLGVDSLAWTEIVLQLEKELNLTIDDEIENINIDDFTVNDLKSFLEEVNE